MSVLIGVASLSMDMSRVVTAKSELQAVSDAAARYAAMAMRSQMANTSAAAANAAAVFAESQVDSTTPSFNAGTDLTLGIWVPATRTFVPTSLALGANAVRIQSSLSMGDASRPLALASILGRVITVKAESIAMMNGTTAKTYVSSKGNPWLAGMPNGSISKSFRTNASEWDYAGSGPNVASSPASIDMAATGITPGATLLFDGVSGASSFTGNPATGNADGDDTKIVTLGSPSFNDYTYFNSPMNGMSNVKVPINSMMAVFLSDADPSTTSAPTPLDFSTAASRDFVSLSPQLKQVFFIGDGRRANGEAQQFIVPAGATRMFIANMDGWQWNNNAGGYNATINSTRSVSTVK